MADPYASVAETYDFMIDWPSRLARERPFFGALLPSWADSRVLDVGCGTGHHCGLFAALGAQVIGLEPSAAMLARARALFPGDNPRFIEGVFSDITSLPGPFDLITVLGNTLAYAVDAEELTAILRAMREQLTPRGRLCIQVVNYDSLPAEASRRLPLIHRQAGDKEYLFLREYRRMGEQVEFTLITLCHEAAWRQTNERSLHLAITGALLCDGLHSAGFTDVALYGDYQRADYNPTSSPSLIAVATRKA